MVADQDKDRVGRGVVGEEVRETKRVAFREVFIREGEGREMRGHRDE